MTSGTFSKALIFEGGAPQLVATLAASGVAADVDALSPAEQDRLADAVARNTAEATVGGELRSEATSHVAFARHYAVGAAGIEPATPRV